MIVEHDMDVVFNLADRISVLSYGRSSASGTPEEIRNNAAVREAYLGNIDGRKVSVGVRVTCCYRSRISTHFTMTATSSTASPLRYDRGEMVAILGRNGVGKSTTLKSIMGIVQPEAGSSPIQRSGNAREATLPYCELGYRLCPRGEKDLSGPYREREPHHGAQEEAREKKLKAERRSRRSTAGFQQLAMRDATPAGSLSGGEQQMLTLARTLMGEPELMLIDEPSEGLSPIVADLIFKLHQRNTRSGGSRSSLLTVI